VAYKPDVDPKAEFEINGQMIRRGIGALDVLAPRLHYVVVPTGTKGYGVHLREKPFEPPYTEDLGRIPKKYADELFYYALVDAISEMQKGKTWSWCEVRPDIIIGFVPHDNAYNVGSYLTNYLSLYAYCEKKGAEVPFPGQPGSWTCKFTEGGQDSIARFSLYASLNAGKSKNSELYNIADCAEPQTWSSLWPMICSHFGLIGVPPLSQETPPLAEYFASHLSELAELGEKYGTELELPFMMTTEVSLFDSLTFDRQMSIQKVKGIGFLEEESPEKVWGKFFERMGAAKRLLVKY